MLTVLTDNIFDQNHFGHHLGKVLVQSETIDFSMKKSVTKAIFQGKIRILKEY